MDVPSAGTGSPIVESLPVESRLPTARLSGVISLSTALALTDGAPLPDDTIAALLASLATPPLHDLLREIEERRFSPDPAVLDNLLRAAETAIAHGDMPRALEAVSSYFTRNPEDAASVVESPVLQPIRSEVRDLLHRLTRDAETEATSRIAAARATDPDSGTILLVAAQLIDSGQLANYIRAAELGKALVSRTAGAVAASSNEAGRLRLQSPKSRRAFPDLLRAAWRRVPLLALFLAWLAAGAAGMALLNPSVLSAAAPFWSLGFLALVALQFFITTRRK